MGHTFTYLATYNEFLMIHDPTFTFSVNLLHVYILQTPYCLSNQITLGQFGHEINETIKLYIVQKRNEVKRSDQNFQILEIRNNLIFFFCRDTADVCVFSNFEHSKIKILLNPTDK